MCNGTNGFICSTITSIQSQGSWFNTNQTSGSTNIFNYYEKYGELETGREMEKVKMSWGAGGGGKRSSRLKLLYRVILII